MQKTDLSENKTWSWIGKAATIVGLLYGIYQLTNLFKSSEYKIYATGEHHVVFFPNSFDDELENFKNNIALDSIMSRIKIGKSYDRIESASSIRDFFNSSFPVDVQKKIRSIHSQWFFSVENTGSKEIRDLNLELPFDGIYSIVRNEKEESSGSFAKTIVLGALRPKNQLEVIVWTSAYSETYNEKRTRITHSNGAFEIEYSVPVRGILAWIDNNYIIVISMSIYVLFVILFFGGRAYYLRRKPSEIIDQHVDSEEKSNLSNEKDEKLT